MVDLIFVIGLVLVLLSIVIALILYAFGVGQCNHRWKVIHDTKYDNIGFRRKYALVIVCDKCGKVKYIYDKK